MSVRGSVLMAKCPHGEMSLRRNIRTAKSHTAKTPTVKSPGTFKIDVLSLKELAAFYLIKMDVNFI